MRLKLFIIAAASPIAPSVTTCSTTKLTGLIAVEKDAEPTSAKRAAM